MNKLTNEQLYDYLYASEKATDGPWFNDKKLVYCITYPGDDRWHIAKMHGLGSEPEEKRDDAEFIAQSRTIGPAAVRELLKARERISILEDTLKKER